MRSVRIAMVLALALGGCASAPALEGGRPDPGPPAALRFGVDTFAFPNESRSRNRGKPDLYANYCFVMARAVIQFQRFARFEPGAPPLSPAGYAERVRQVVVREPWADPLPPAERVVIPGYGALHDLSRGQERAVKAGLVGRFWTLVHWTNWRVVLPVPGWHQEAVAREVMAEIAAGRPAQLLITNFPTIELNHTVVAYGYRAGPGGDVTFTVYDPNDPAGPGLVTYEAGARRFRATRLHDTTAGPIRAFRMYYRALL